MVLFFVRLEVKSHLEVIYFHGNASQDMKYKLDMSYFNYCIVLPYSSISSSAQGNDPAYAKDCIAKIFTTA
ncbi:hypothetical protein KUTeg_005922 [Tegillarca granosa]|uniref:Uncharacterized protein n=1 Tax=Tegillarca granosa TaxID=220873 RepID=A0ABQ9FLE2_TEGGR|nr:hypothetical protein KUTeg_005922 [Tegillarca granosa]